MKVKERECAPKEGLEGMQVREMVPSTRERILLVMFAVAASSSASFSKPALASPFIIHTGLPPTYLPPEQSC
jgi:hypothetical protein